MNELEKLLNEVKKDVESTLKNEVADMVKEKIADHAQTDVYDVYTPKSYKRQYGLKDMDNMKVDEIGDLNIKVYNDTVYDEEYIPTVVETGEGYDYQGYGYAYEEPRPFMQNTQEELEREKTHIKVFKNALKNKGYKID